MTRSARYSRWTGGESGFASPMIGLWSKKAYHSGSPGRSPPVSWPAFADSANPR